MTNYQPPDAHEPDDNWWDWLEFFNLLSNKTAAIGKLKLSMKITYVKHTHVQQSIQPWCFSVAVILYLDELNAKPQPFRQKNKNIKKYLTTAPGQAYLAGLNFLLLKAVNTLKQQSRAALVEKIDGNQIHLYSTSAIFTVGEQLPVYYRQANHIAEQSFGQLEIIQSMQHRAIAYPINFTADHIRVGDWAIAADQQNTPTNPEFFFKRLY